MAVPTLITDLSTTAASNSPSGSENVFPNLDDYLRAQAAFLASVRDNSGNGWVSPYLATTGGTMTGTITGLAAPSMNGGHLGLRNKIANGNMSVFSQGTTAVTTSDAYGPADKWLNQSVGNTFSTSQGSFASGDTLFDTGGAQYFTAVAVTSAAAAANYTVLAQRMSNVTLLAGQTVTVSFWAKAASGTPSIGVSVDQNFGSGGSPSSAVYGTGQAQALSTTWTQYSKTFTIPSINGKTLGTTAGTSYTQLSFWLDAGADLNTRSGSIGQSSKTVSIAQVQMEVGSVVTLFERRQLEIESILCGVGAFTGDVTLPSINGGQIAYRNKLINGNMGIFQRGTAAVTTSGNYGPADRWVTNSVGNTFSSTQGAFVSGDTLYDTGGAQYFTQVAVTSVAAATNFTNFPQRIEDVRLLAGQTVTVSFWAKAASGTPSIALEIAQDFGSGGSPSANVTGTGQVQALTTTWAKYTKTFSVPSINGKTVGTTANTSFTQLIFWLDAGANFATRSGSIGQSSKTVSIAQVQLEIGSVATPFEQRPIGMELALCQRYYFKTFQQGAAPATAAGTAGALQFVQAAGASADCAVGTLRFPVCMRVTPTTTTIYNTTSANNQFRNLNNAVDWSSSVVEVLGQSGISFNGTTAAGSAAGARVAFHVTAEAEL